MILFQSDYLEGAHPRILERLAETNLEQTAGYGEDEYCKNAAQILRSLCLDDNLAVHFLTGGTQTNLTVIDAALRPHQGVITAATGHIHVHETGAVEATGHKVIALPSEDGRLRAQQIEAVCLAHEIDSSREHTVQPKMVYISNPTELGTIYSRQELRELSDVCRRHGLYLFLDGARLGYGLAAADNDLDLPCIAACTDVFYLGGTKGGALFGEAVVIRNETVKQDFRYLMKQKGGMLAKGRLLGLQFEALLEDGLYFQLAERANLLADELRAVFLEKGYSFLAKNRTNQIFPIMPDSHLEQLNARFGYSYERRIDNSHSAVRFCTSWATTQENVEQLKEAIRELRS